MFESIKQFFENENSNRLRYSLISQIDLEEVRSLHNQEAVLKQLTVSREISFDEQKEWFSNLQKSKTSVRILARLIETNELVGVFRIDKFDILNRSVQIGLDNHPRFHGMGFGTEIYQFMIPMLFNRCDMNRLYLETLRTNTVALNLYEKLGFIQEGIGREAIIRNNGFIDLIYLGLLRKDI